MNAEILAIIAPVFLCAGVGFAWHKFGMPYDTALVGRLLINVTTPCLVFSRLSALQVSADEFAVIAFAAVAAIVLFGGLGWAALRALRVPTAAGLGPIMFPNCGNMGLALSLFAFGDEGLAFGLGFFVVAATAQFTLAPWLASGHFSWSQILRAPLIYVTAISIVLLSARISVPEWLYNTTNLLGNVSIPMMLITLGVSLASLSVANLKNSAVVAVLRLAIGFGVGVLLVSLLDLDGIPRGIVILMCSMPPAVFNYLFAERYSDHADEVAGTVVLATAISFLTLPLLLAFILGGA